VKNVARGGRVKARKTHIFFGAPAMARGRRRRKLDALARAML
jgi:hypothetical protein